MLIHLLDDATVILPNLQVILSKRAHSLFTILSSDHKSVNSASKCLLTDPDIPHDFAVKSWNSHSLSLAWDCPEKFSFFLLTAFYLNGVDHITEEVLFLVQDNFEFVLSDLEPCTKVKFGLQTVCQAGVESRYSKMVLNDGNSGKPYSGLMNLQCGSFFVFSLLIKATAPFSTD